MRATKKTSKKKHSWKEVFLFPEMTLFFFVLFFYPPKLFFFFRKSATIQCVSWAEKKTQCFFLVMRGLNLMRAFI